MSATIAAGKGMFDLMGKMGGAWSMFTGNRQQGQAVNQMARSADEIRGTFDPSQQMINRMTNFNAYSAPGMDAATMAGNKGVETAAMTGLGGSAANAIKNRLRTNNTKQIYDSWQAGLGDATKLQVGIDSNVSDTLAKENSMQAQYRFGLGGQRHDRGVDMLGPGGIPGLLQQAGGIFS
jgi:hypothetical protein